MLDNLINSLRLKEDEEDEGYMDEIVEEERVLPFKKATKSESVGGDTIFKPQSLADIVISKPKVIDDAKTVIDLLMEGKSVVVDLELTEDDMKQRIIDMISGYCYTFNCNIEKVNNKIFMISNARINTEE